MALVDVFAKLTYWKLAISTGISPMYMCTLFLTCFIPGAIFLVMCDPHMNEL